MSETKGLEGVTAGNTSICTVGKEGDDLKYRGYSIIDLSNHALFEEVAYLLLHKKLPTQAELDSFLEKLHSVRGLSQSTQTALKALPKDAHPMDVLRTGVSILGCEYPETDDNTWEVAHRLLANLPEMVLTWHAHHNPVDSTSSNETSIAGCFLEKLLGKPVLDEDRASMNCSLILYAEHGFNASTFACRVTTATLSDMYSAVCSGIGTLKGPLHGGANEKAMEMIKQFTSVDQAVAFINDALEKKIKIMGFGHRVYKIKDPRSDFMKNYTKRLAERLGDNMYFDISVAIEKTMKEKKGMFPNVDFYAAAFYYYLGIPIPLYTPIFAISRVSGWIAHIFEQRENNRLIRPKAEYVGPESQTFIPISERN